MRDAVERLSIGRSAKCSGARRGVPVVPHPRNQNADQLCERVHFD